MNRFALVSLVIIILTSSTLTSVSAESPTANVPDFTIQYVDRSYDVPITHYVTTDPFTGKQVDYTQGGNHVENKTIDIVIKNQPFTPIDLGNGSIVQLYYTVRGKGHYANWDPPVGSNGYTQEESIAASSENTIITLVITEGDNGLLMGQGDVVISEGGTEDFQVKAVIGFEEWYHHPAGFDYILNFHTISDSGWSASKTITIGESVSIMPTQQPSVSEPLPTEGFQTATPQTSNQGSIIGNISMEITALLIGLVIAVVTLAIGMVLLWRRVKPKPIN